MCKKRKIIVTLALDKFCNLRREIFISLLLLMLCGNFAVAQEALLRFGVVADCQSAQSESEEKRERRYTLSPTKLTEAIASFNREHVDLAVSLGDLVEGDMESFRELEPILSEAQMELYHVLGNHDYLLGDSLKRAMKVMGIKEPGYYSRVKNGVRLIFLNSNENAIYTVRKGSAEYAAAEQRLAEQKATSLFGARPYSGEVSERQMKWLEEELQAAEAAGEIVVLMSHHPLYYPIDLVTMSGSERVRALIERYDCVKTHISGHFHRGGYSRINGVDYLILKGMVEGDNNRYAIVNIYPDRIEIDGRGDEEDRTLKFIQK